MQYITLGKTGLRISRLGFGGIPIQRIDENGTRDLILKMAELGVNFIDTARGYTVSEEYLGYALDGVRDKFVIATKSMSRDRDGMARDIETSLKNLRTDYIDLYQVHNATASQLDEVMAKGGALEALLDAKKNGKIGHIGMTAHSLESFEYALTLDWVETIMFPYNVVETQGEDLIARCREKNIGFIAMKPLAGGAIEDARLAVRFILQNEAVSVVIPGMATLDELACNVASAEDLSPLGTDELSAVDTVRKTLGTEFCRRCNYCAPCSVGIPISAVFLFEGYLSRYGLEKWARERYATLPAKASACIECGVCESRCPYNLPIRKMLKKAAKGFGE